jgi:sugar lactone lactonase YvrE
MRIMILAVAMCIFAASFAAAEEPKVEQVADGLVFPEGPVWHPDGYLIFSDVHGATIERLLPGGGSVPWMDAGHKTNGLIMNNDGTKVLACCHGHLEFLEIDAKTTETRVLAKDANGRPFNNVNDVAIDKAGNIFFTDPKWGAKPGDVQGVYRIAPDGKLSLAAEMTSQPNGIVVSPDQKWVYVARSGGVDVWRFELVDGELRNGAQWVQLEKGGGPDGMTVDSRGNVFVAQAGNGKLTVLSPSGKTLQQVQVFERMATNCEFEGAAAIVCSTSPGTAETMSVSAR